MRALLVSVLKCLFGGSGRTSRFRVAVRFGVLVGLGASSAGAYAQIDPWAPPEPNPPLQSVTPLGFTVFRSEFHRLFAPLEEQPYDEQMIRKAIDALVDRYHTEGYIYAEIDWERDVDIDLLEGRDRGYYVRVRIHEGTINSIRVEGLARTRDAVIIGQLLLREGQLLREQDAEESERILREKSYVGRVDIRSAPSATRDGVDVVVFMTDLWSFVPKFRVINGAEGSLLGNLIDGDIGFRVRLRDSNLWGTGQTWRMSYQWLASEPVETRDPRATTRRRRVGVEFREPNVFGSRWQMSARFQDPASTEVGTWEFRLAHPFYSLRTRWSAEFHATEQGVVRALYFGGKLLRRWDQRLQQQFVSATRSFGRPENQLRLSFWMRHTRRHWSLRDNDLPVRRDPSFLAVPIGEEAFRYTSDSVSPDEQALIGPALTWHNVRFAEARNLNRLGRVEDLTIGNTARVSLGIGRRALGDDHDRVVPQVAVDVTRWNDETVYWRVDGSLETPYVYHNGREGPEGFQDVAATVGGRMLYRVGSGHTIAARVRGLGRFRTTGDFSLQLRNATGVRGYGHPGLDGSRRVVVNVEARQLFRQSRSLVLAGVGFYDHGYAWWHGAGLGSPLRSIGVGIRLAVLAIAGSPILRGDLAYTLDSVPAEWDFSFGTGQYF